MKLFLDTNILIDVVANRQPWVDDALVLLELANQKKLTLMAADYSFINIAYITRKLFPTEDLRLLLKDLRKYVEVVDIGADVIDKVLNDNWKDFEDCVQYYTALSKNADVIITRNKRDCVVRYSSLLSKRVSDLLFIGDSKIPMDVNFSSQKFLYYKRSITFAH